MIRRILLLILLALLFSAATAATFEESYDTEFNKLKDTRDYVYRDGDTIQWQIVNYDPMYEYYIRIYAYRHTSILKEWRIDKPTGEIKFTYPGFLKVHINLQKWIPEGKDLEYCKSYPCKIGENLDIVTITPDKKTAEFDIYTMKLRYWTRNSFDQINGASWQAVINSESTKQ